MRTTDDAIRGRVFTALESVIRVSLLISMAVMAPLGDLIARIVFLVAARIGIPYNELYVTGPRITLWLSSLIVLGAAVYAFRTLEWRRCEDEPCPPELSAASSGTPPSGPPSAEVTPDA